MATVMANLAEGTKVTIETRQFSWRADEPPEASGTDTGPTPYELLLGSLAACIATTLRLYANHKSIPLAGVGVHSDDCEDCDARTDGWIERIQSNVTIRGRFDTAQRKRLAQVAQRCPVHKTLANGVEIMDSVELS